MKFLKNFLMVIVIIIVLLIIGRWYLGGFTTPVATEKPMGPYVMAYVTFTGEYKNVGPTMDKLYASLSGEGITSTTGAGIYYTSPTDTGDTMKSDVGSIVDAQQAKKLDKKSPNYKIQIIPGGNKVVVEFPYKNTFSYMVGPIRVYPVMNAYMSGHGYSLETPRIELYDITAKKMYYMANIVK